MGIFKILFFLVEAVLGKEHIYLFQGQTSLYEALQHHGWLIAGSELMDKCVGKPGVCLVLALFCKGIYILPCLEASM